MILVAIEVDTYDDDLSAVHTKLLSNGRLSGTLGLYEDRLSKLPIMLGTAISIEVYGQAVRGGSNQGSVDFVVDQAIYSWFADNVHWIGAKFRAYEGDILTELRSDLTLVFTGRVSGLRYTDTSATITMTDASYDLDGPIIDDLFPSDALEGLIGHPKPQIWGRCKSVAPVFDQVEPPIYLASRAAAPLDNVTDVRVGGISWNRASISSASQGQWYFPAGLGYVRMGSPTLGFDVRVDAQSIDYASMTTAELVNQIVATAGTLTVDVAYLAALASDYPALVGYRTLGDPVNRLDALDEIMTSAVGWWAVGSDETLACGVIAEPGTPDFTLDDVLIASCEVTEILPPAWRIRVENDRHWDPGSNFIPEITEDSRQFWSAGGANVSTFEDATIKIAEPRAQDVPLIRALCLSATDGDSVLDRAVTAFSTTRRLFTVSAWMPISTVNSLLYKTCQLTYQMWDLPTRVHSVQRAIGGGGPWEFILWG